MITSIIQVIQLYIFLCLYITQCIRRKFKPVQSCIITLLGMLIVLVLELINASNMISIIFLLVETCILFATIMVCSRKEDLKSIFSALIIVDMLSAGRLVYLVTSELLSSWMISQIAMAIVQLVLFIIVRGQLKKLNHTDSKLLYNTVLVAPILLLIVICMTYMSLHHTFYVYINVICICALTVVVYLLSQQYIEESIHAQNQKLENMLMSQLSKQIERQLTIEQNNEQRMKELRHDMRHYDRMIKESIIQHNYHQAIELINSKDEVYDSTKKTYYCDNPLLNTLFNSFTNQYLNKVEFEINAFVPKKLQIDQVNLSTVISNLMENAAEATLKSAYTTKKVSVLVNYDKNRLIIEIKNPLTSNIEYNSNGIPVSQKGEGHGLGMKSIQRFAKQYKGTFDIAEEEGNFVVRILIQA